MFNLIQNICSQLTIPKFVTNQIENKFEWFESIFTHSIYSKTISIEQSEMPPPARTDAYYHDDEPLPHRKNWMSELPDDVGIRQLTIPGTHNSCARLHDDFFKNRTQTQGLTDQLNAGIRFLDIRCRHYRDAFPIHHGSFFNNILFNNVIDECRDFLKANRSETILMRISKEHTEEENTRSFEDTFLSYYNKHEGLFWKPKHNKDDMPTLKDTRGKIVILQYFDASKVYGLVYDSKDKNTKHKLFDIQDDWDLGTIFNLYNKWEKIKAHLNKAKSGNVGNGMVNYLSGSGWGVMPYFVASGHIAPGSNEGRLWTGKLTPAFNDWPDFPRINCFIGICSIYYEGMNILAKEFILREKSPYYGIVVADFPGIGLIDALINTNKKKPKAMAVASASASAFGRSQMDSSNFSRAAASPSWSSSKNKWSSPIMHVNSYAIWPTQDYLGYASQPYFSSQSTMFF